MEDISSIVVTAVTHKTNRLDMWALGLTIVLGGQYLGWNIGLTSGFGSFAISTFLIGSSYFCLCLGNSEFTSALPYAGGLYGLSRCTLGFYPGFLMGCSEMIEYILYTAASVVSFGDILVIIAPDLEPYEPLVWLAFYVSALGIYFLGGKYFWYCNMVLALISLIPIIMYIFGSMPWVDFNQNASGGMDWFQGGFYSFLQKLPLASWFYVGIETLSFAADEIDNPKSAIPVAQMACISTLVILSIFVLFVSVSLPTLDDGDILNAAAVPLNTGFQLMFNISSNTATLLSLPAIYATAFGFIFAYGKLAYAMAESRLLPSVLTHRLAGSNTPFAAMVAGSVMGYGACILVYFQRDIYLYLFNICILCGFCNYISQCYGLVYLRTKFSNLPREFRSPFGIYGAIYATLVFAMGTVSIVFLQEDNQLVLVILVCMFGVFSLYYLAVRKQQTISEEEKKILFIAHVINYNTAKNKPRNSNSLLGVLKSRFNTSVNEMGGGGGKNSMVGRQSVDCRNSVNNQGGGGGTSKTDGESSSGKFSKPKSYVLNRSRSTTIAPGSRVLNEVTEDGGRSSSFKMLSIKRASSGLGSFSTTNSLNKTFGPYGPFGSRGSGSSSLAKINSVTVTNIKADVIPVKPKSLSARALSGKFDMEQGIQEETTKERVACLI